MSKRKLSTLSLGVIAVASGLSLGALATSAAADNEPPKLIEAVAIEKAPVPTNVSFVESSKTENTDEESIPKTSSYVNYTKERMSEVIRLYAILENCTFDGGQKDEYIYYLSEYVTTAVQAEKFTAKDLKDEYITFAMSFQPPHPTQEDCIESYGDVKEVVTYWNEKKNTAYNELFSQAKNRYSPDPDEGIDVIQEVVEIPKKTSNDVYSLTYNSKKLPWNISSTEIFTSTPKPEEDNAEETQIIPDNNEHVNKMAIIDEPKKEEVETSDEKK